MILGVVRGLDEFKRIVAIVEVTDGVGEACRN